MNSKNNITTKCLFFFSPHCIGENSLHVGSKEIDILEMSFKGSFLCNLE